MLSRRLILRPRTAFATRLAGDILFGQLCWTVRRLCGEAVLEELLSDYLNGRPFAVLSDAFPSGFLPLPAWPSFFWADRPEEDRKSLAARRWLGLGHLAENPRRWRSFAKNDEQAYGGSGPVAHPQPRNAINRLTGATGPGDFAPYARTRIWFPPEAALDVYAVLDENRLKEEVFMAALEEIGQTGYGRDASRGSGKFELDEAPETPAWPAAEAESFLTLAPCAPQGLGYVSEHSWYRLKTHFGRHGEAAALGPNPFKRPLLMAETGAVFTLREKSAALWLGQGLGRVSLSDPRTVHQGYAPVCPLAVQAEPRRDHD